MSRLRLIVPVVISSSLFAPTLCVGKLGNVSFDDLLKESSLIILANSIETTRDDTGRGHTILKVEQVVRGQYAGATITLAWPGREDDNGILEIGRDYLVFLHKQGERHGPAIHGVSCWPVSYARDLRQIVEYRYPTAYVEVPEELISTVELIPMGRTGHAPACKVEAIVLQKLLDVIRATR